MIVLLSEMLTHADPSQVDGLSRFFKTGPGQYGEGDKFLGIKVPVTREVVKGCWRALDFDDLEECVSSEYHEVRLAALLALVEIFAHVDKRPRVKPGVTEIKPKETSFRTRSGISRESCVDFYLAHTRYINNWDLVDLSCYPLLGVWLLDKDRALLYELARNGKTIWEQRIGIVSTMTFIRHGQLSDTFAIADILLHHPHDLIHKAVGWLLREAGKRDKAALEAWLQEIPGQARGEGEKAPSGASGDRAGMVSCDSKVGAAGFGAAPRYKSMPRTMLRYAIEKFPEAERQRYLRG
jgi:3-methyladenine DNA glycosylase AlkD